MEAKRPWAAGETNAAMYPAYLSSEQEKVIEPWGLGSRRESIQLIHSFFLLGLVLWKKVRELLSWIRTIRKVLQLIELSRRIGKSPFLSARVAKAAIGADLDL